MNNGKSNLALIKTFERGIVDTLQGTPDEVEVLIAFQTALIGVLAKLTDALEMDPHLIAGLFITATEYHGSQVNSIREASAIIEHIRQESRNG